jgi:hypothetical protein
MVIGALGGVFALIALLATTPPLERRHRY